MTRKFIALTIAALMLQACSGHGDGPRRGPPGAGGFMMGPGGGPGGAGAAPREAQLRRFDADADGKITRDEFDKVIKADLAVCDKDGNGDLSAGETRACNDKLLTDRTNTSPVIDWNADGRVALDEFAAQWRTLFERADDDRDGIISAEELARPTTGTGGPPDGPGGQGGRRPPGGGPPGGGPPGGGRGGGS